MSAVLLNCTRRRSLLVIPKVQQSLLTPGALFTPHSRCGRRRDSSTP